MATPVYNTATLNLRMTDVLNGIDGGSTNGIFRLLDATNNILSSMTLSKPSGTVSSGILTFIGLPWVDPAAAAGGNAAKARIENSSGNIVVSGLTVGSGSTAYDVVLSPTATIGAGQTVTITLASITGR